jgi:hypothetical protein
MSGQPTLMAALLNNKGLHRYGSFCHAYEKAVRSLDGKPALREAEANLVAGFPAICTPCRTPITAVFLSI